MLQAIERLPGSLYRCICDCGNERLVKVGHFNSGKIKSCGCHAGRHGHAGSKRSRTYISYHNMMARCHKPENKRYKDYGAKGIFVCDRWRDSFHNFLDDMGECPEGETIDRIDNNKGYEPGNCRWATRSKNQRNRSVSKIWIVNGFSFETMADASREFNVSISTIRAWCQGRTSEGRWYPPREGCSVMGRYGNNNEAPPYEREGLIELK